ncbi:MAG: hypothetical protein PHU25_18835 [Deltaproteobacteria bacterium]|nr:hypothetical protein [Deltaproteobacteria bacterium]
MKLGLLTHVPSEAELARLYQELSSSGLRLAGRKRPWPYRPADLESLLALGGEMLRYDARLLAVLLRFFLARWGDLNPLLLRRRMAGMGCPQALLVMLGFARLASRDAELGRLIDYLFAGWPRLHPEERFFLDAAAPGSRTALRALGRNLAPYARWGFVGTERPVADTGTRQALGSYDAGTRRRILLDLVERRGAITLADYLDAVDHAVTRQQALADLRASPGLVLHGRGRGAVWRRKRLAQADGSRK